MSFRQVEAFDWICDGCGFVKLARDVPPTGWTLSEDGEDHLCAKCSPSPVRWTARSKDLVTAGLFEVTATEQS